MHFSSIHTMSIIKQQWNAWRYLHIDDGPPLNPHRFYAIQSLNKCPSFMCLNIYALCVQYISGTHLEHQVQGLPSTTWCRKLETGTRYWPFVRGIHWSPINSPHKGHWRGALMFSFVCDWISVWVNIRKAGNLRRNHAHYDVTLMNSCLHSSNVQIITCAGEIYCYTVRDVRFVHAWTVLLYNSLMKLRCIRSHFT